jgi:menaquinol-cytochrome c reductase iron-sulfur subunit
MAGNPGNEEITRRRFLGYFIGGISGVIGVVVASPVIGYFLSPAWKKKAPLFTVIASVNEIPIGQPTFVTYEERIRDGWYITTLSKGVWLVNKDGKELTVFDPRCTHLNCPYYWDKEKQIFHCPCHDGRFDIDGNVIGGPPPRPLDRLEFTIEGGNVLVSDRIIRGGED